MSYAGKSPMASISATENPVGVYFIALSSMLYEWVVGKASSCSTSCNGSDPVKLPLAQEVVSASSSRADRLEGGNVFKKS